MTSRKTGAALAGWKYDQTDHGILLTLQLADSVASYHNRDFERVQVALNERQLRSLTRDLTRAADSRGIELWGARRWWTTLLRFTARKPRDKR